MYNTGTHACALPVVKNNVSFCSWMEKTANTRCIYIHEETFGQIWNAGTGLLNNVKSITSQGAGCLCDE